MARKHGQARLGARCSVQAGVPEPAAEQGEELGGVGDRDAVGVRVDEQRLRGEFPDLFSPVERLAQQLPGLIHQRGEGIGVWSHSGPRRVHRGALHLGKASAADLIEGAQHLGEPAVTAVGDGDHSQPADAVWVLDGSPQAGVGTERVSQEIGLFQAEVLDHAGHIVTEGFVAEGSVDVTRVSVTLQLYRDDSSAPGELIDEFAQHADQTEASVHDDKRRTAAPEALSVDLHPIDGRVALVGRLAHLASLALAVLDRDRLDPLVRGQRETEDLGVEAELRVHRPANVLRPPEAVLLTFEGEVGHRYALDA